MIRFPARRRANRRPGHDRAARPTLESLETRFLLYATTGGYFSQTKRITYSFVPDGTSIGGVPSNLFQTLNAKFTTVNWQQQFAKAAATWQKVANINLVQVADGGQPIGIGGNQQGDSRFGDIRIGGFTQTSGQLAFAYLPPPFNGGTAAGDMFFNTAQSWQTTGTTFDLETVAIHEFGHSLGMDHSAATTSAAMWPYYTASKWTLNTDDINGIRTIYNGRQNDYFDANGANDAAKSADDITPWLDSSGQLTLSGLDSTTPIMIGQGGDVDWYKVTVPANTNGTMVVRMQSTGLSVLSPYLEVYNSAGTTRLGQDYLYDYGATVSVTITGVLPGQVYDLRCRGATAGDSGFGNYGLQVNFGSGTQAPVSAPNTTLAESVSQGGGSLSEGVGDPSSDDGGNAGGDAGDQGGYWVYNEGDSLVSEDSGEVVSEATGVDPVAADPSTAVESPGSPSVEVPASGSLEGAFDSLTTGGSPGGHGPGCQCGMCSLMRGNPLALLNIPRPASLSVPASLAHAWDRAPTDVGAALATVVSLPSTSGDVAELDASDPSSSHKIGAKATRVDTALHALDHALDRWRG